MQKDKWLKKLGPGLMYAGVAVGVSHLVNSTKAGALFGFALIPLIVIANLIKLPFFEIGPRYAVATGKSLLQGYRQLGNWAFCLLILLTLSTMFIIQAAVTVVTAGLLNKMLGLSLPPWQLSLILLAVCGLILAFNNFSLLDNLMKVIMIILSVATLVAVIASFTVNVEVKPEFLFQVDLFKKEHLIFLVVLFGWMPGPLDITIWHSIWTLAKDSNKGPEETQNKQNKKEALKTALFDFHVGYWGTALLAVLFLSLGALIMYGSGTQFSKKGGEFAGQLISMYTKCLGNWSYAIILIAAFTTMFSTTLTALDGFGRLLGQASLITLAPKKPRHSTEKKFYILWISIVIVGSLVLLAGFIKNMGQMVKIATTISFLTTPIIAILNYVVMMRTDVPDEFKPGKKMQILSKISIAIFLVFSVIFLIVFF